MIVALSNVVQLNVPVRGSSRLVATLLTGERHPDVLLAGILTALKLIIMNIKNKKLLVIGVLIFLIILFSILNTLG
ncbi:hypothetical protein [Fulvivirga sp.]|jgi:hypothetical protein|uniref:hypothetical protein n=1 Tax=Fulvivirga sp. TaxID=1931237 RepID=UPI0032ED45E1